MKTSIVIPTYNHLEDCLKPCIESIIVNTDLNNNEVIIVANGCKDGTQTYITDLSKKYPSIKLIDDPNPLGYTVATNLGIKHSIGEFVILLNNDTVIQDNTWIPLLLEPFFDPNVAVTGPMKAWSPEVNRMFMIFFCVAIRGNLLRSNLMDEAFNPGFGEDTDLCVKFENMGYKLVQVPDETRNYADTENRFMVGKFPIWHKGEATLCEHPDGNALLRKNRAILKAKWGKDIKINVACGDKILEDYVNVDLVNTKADVVGVDCRCMPMFADGVAEEILAVHILEHFQPQEVHGILAEFNRILKPGGKLILEMPDILELCRAFEKADKNGRYHLLNCIYGTGMPEFPHLFGWYDEILTDHLFSAGFICITKKEAVYPHWGINIRMESIKTMPELERDLPDGFFSIDNIVKYRELLEKVPDNGCIAELGVFRGKSLCSVADIIKRKNINVVAVDTFGGSIGEGDEYLVKTMQKEDIKSNFLNNIDRFGIRNNIELRAMTTTEAAKLGGSFDLVFIDANHSYESCKEDIINWKPLVKNGGIISGHDYIYPFNGVIQAVKELCPEHDVAHSIWTHRIIGKPNIYDTFMLFNELDLLEVRLETLYNHVDRFIICEAMKTHTRQPKPLYFDQNKERFAKYLNKITYLVIPDFPPGDPWAAENYQREFLLNGLKDLKDNDIVIHTDLDEIPNPDKITDKISFVSCLRMKLYYYFLNCECITTDWGSARIATYKAIKQLGGLCALRYYNGAQNILDAGWHFSYIGGVKKIIEKIEAWSHHEYNKPEFKNEETILKAITSGQDIFGRKEQYKFVDIDNSFPVFIVKNPKKFIESGMVYNGSNC